MSQLTSSSGRTQYATFEVSGHYLGIRVLEVQEVLREQPITPVPLAPSLIAGLINVRGQIIPALEIRRLFDINDAVVPEGELSVVLQTETGPVSLQVDDIGDVIEIESASLEAPPLSLGGDVRRLLSGVCQTRGRVLLVLDTARAIDVSTAYETNHRTTGPNSPANS